MTFRMLRGLIGAPPTIHNTAQARPLSTLARGLNVVLPTGLRRALYAVETPREPWSNALSFPLDAGALSQVAAADGLFVECRVRVHEGLVGIALMAEDGSAFLSNERVVAPQDQPRTVRIWAREPDQVRHLLFRNVAPGDRPSRFELLALTAYLAPGARHFAASWSRPPARTIPGRELAQLLAWSEQVWDRPFGGSPEARGDSAIEIVDVEDLARDASAPPLRQDRARSLADWKMETDDAPLLARLWRSRAPRRHLEFGTWEGFGAALVAAHSEAEIWTLNLPEGEVAADGVRLYAEGDSGQRIGWKYRAAGVAARVHQILCDSREFDTTPFEPAFFDTVLIDGGHTPDLVENDTRKALRVVKPGGLVVWHDFCPDADALSRNLAPLGVVHAVVAHLDEWRPLFARLYWIRNSWLLVGELRSDRRA